MDEDPTIKPSSISNPCQMEEVKSRAVVKYSAPKPATFAKLQYNTDLNLPPSNWLSSSVDSYGLQRVLYHPKGFSSFRMAHMFPDCVGEVDVVSDAENIKNLLKIPYCKGHISMMVHRVENTLLLDDFDIYKHLLKTSETEWEWLKKFFSENITPETYEEDKRLYVKNRTQKALKQKSLVSKFLYHSLVEGESTVSENPEGPLNSYQSQSPDLPLPDPSPNTECPDNENFDGQFNRNVLWTFEDIEMLLGTDMPIFGGGTHPCISLRLKDMNKPISVLTGIDYWLDNLMSNVPEVVMCYHLNGIVQKYELIKTEDLPRLDNSKFSPKLIRDVAQSILSFLKSNATKAGHTYWLFKGKDEEVIKLYDLTSLCSEEDVSGENPFTIPVAMLLYRVARNMKHSSDRRPQPGTIRMLLKNCIKLLPEESYPEIVTSSHYMLSDLYIPAHLNPECPDFDDQTNADDDESESIYDDDDDDLNDSSIAVLDLEKCDQNDKFTNHYKTPPPLLGTLEERCLQAVYHVAAGLNCLQFFTVKEKNIDGGVQKERQDEDEIPMAKPFEAIPMPYGKINEQPEDSGNKSCHIRSKKMEKKDKNRKMSVSEEDELCKEGALLPKSKNEAQSTWKNVNSTTISWKDHLKTLLLEKTVLVYATLVEKYFKEGKFGSCLRVLAILARCQLALSHLDNAPGGDLRLSVLLGRAGDACLMIVAHWREVDSYREQLFNHQDEDLNLLRKLEQDERANRVNLGESVSKCVFIPDLRTIEQLLVKAVECYEVALKIAPSESLSYRLANSLNEIASHYLSVAKQAKNTGDIVHACKKAEPFLNKGLEIFENLNNDANISLLSSNIGHLHRLLAYAHAPEERTELTSLEKKHYNKAIQSYKRALRVLGERTCCPGIWDAITWELSTVLFTLSCIMFENPPSDLSKQEAERQILESLQMAVEHCDMNEDNPKFPLYQYRAATLHFRIGSLWHGHAWNNKENKKQHAIQLALLHYEKALRLFWLSGDALPYLTAQMQRVALVEFLVEGSTTPAAKLKHLKNCLQIFTELSEFLQAVIDKKIDIPPETNKPPDTGQLPTQGNSFQTLFSLLKLVKTRLQHVLKMLVKVCSGKPQPTKDSAKLVDLYKDCYKATFTLTDNLSCDQLLSNLNVALTKIKGYMEN